MKRGTPRHPKTKELARHLRVEVFAAVGILESLWHFTGEFAPEGNIGRVTDQAIADAIGWRKPAETLIEALVFSGWLERHDLYRLVIHDWSEHADDSVRKFLKRHHRAFLPIYKVFVRTDDGQVTDSVRHTRAGSGSGKGSGSFSSEESPRETKDSKPDAAPDLGLQLVPLPPQQYGDWPLTARAVHEFFPDCDLPWIERLAAACAQTFVSVAKPNCEFSDALVADAVRRVYKRGQDSAGLFGKTVPACIRTWATEGIRARASPDGKTVYQQQKSARMLQLAKDMGMVP